MLNISENKCVGCGICMSACPQGIEILNGIARIKDESADCLKNVVKVCPQGAIRDVKEKLIIAIGTDDGEKVKSGDHVGMSVYFDVYEYFNGDLNFIERRKNAKYKEDESRVHGDPGKAKATSSVLGNVDVLVGKILGPNIVRLRDKFVCAVVRESLIEKAKEIIKQNINEIIEEKDKEQRKGVVLR